MSSKVVYRLCLAIEKIDQIFDICEEKGTVEALKDEKLAKPAIMKHFDVIHQQFEKMEKAQEYKTLSRFDQKDLKGIRSIRNWSSHDYDNIENEIIEKIIREILPNFKKSIQEVLKETKKDLQKD
ncbi:HepT-like ribonuclease domain-containing protein [Campylobacter pinnipediorum]|uniref:HepT-like ribonuclease domain-containing protein n=1 Tax=Campylobacter pinnipediorum TaxID=1965231 RepID=UPI0009C1ADB4|nr:HepT-like ribonuclease domain-containing protein [Campylobacter pinnipediorum]AQW86811.1 hypothetical protein CPIN18020_1634 [Campylobacter pinnipediorum subsp. caledonicus]